MEEDIAFFQRHQPVFPPLRNGAFLRQQGPCAELEGDLAEFGIVDPFIPVTQIPDATRHHDRRRIGNARFAHHVAQRFDAGIGIFGLQRVFGVGQAVVATRQPGVFINDRAQKLWNLRIGPLPQRAEGAAGADDGQIGDAEFSGDFRQLIRHARATGDAVDQAFGLFQNAAQNGLRTAHFPQDVDVDGALARRDFVGALHLRNGAFNAELDQLFMPFPARLAVVHLGRDLAGRVIAVRIHRRDSTDAACCRPSARTGMVGRRNALAAFNQRPDFASVINDRLQSLKHSAPVSIPFVRPLYAVEFKMRGFCSRVRSKIGSK